MVDGDSGRGQASHGDGGGGPRGGGPGRLLDWRAEWPALAIILAAAAATLLAWPHLHGIIASHYGLGGRPNAWAPARRAAVTSLGVLAGVYLLTALLPRIDPRRENYRRFGPALSSLRLVLTLFLAGMLGLTLAAGLGHPVDARRMVFAGVSLLLIFLGNLMPRLRSNWFFGVRTPWTLASDDVWRATQRVGGRATVLAGLFGLPLAWFGLVPAWIADLLVLAVALPVVYSYLAWRGQVRP